MLAQHEIESAYRHVHECPNVRKGVNLLYELMRSVNAQSDGWAYWPPPGRSIARLVELLKTAGNFRYRDTEGTITEAQLRKAVAPIRSMVTRQKKLQAQRGNKFDFDVDAALEANHDVHTFV